MLIFAQWRSQKKKHILSLGLQQIQLHVLYSGRSHRMLLHMDWTEKQEIKGEAANSLATDVTAI